MKTAKHAKHGAKHAKYPRPAGRLRRAVSLVTAVLCLFMAVSAAPIGEAASVSDLQKKLEQI